jgi:hypothetical protein
MLTVTAIACRVCGTEFKPRRSDAVTCSARCRQRLRRGHALDYIAGLPLEERRAARDGQAARQQQREQMRRRSALERDQRAARANERLRRKVHKELGLAEDEASPAIEPTVSTQSASHRPPHAAPGARWLPPDPAKLLRKLEQKAKAKLLRKVDFAKQKAELLRKTDFATQKVIQLLCQNGFPGVKLQYPGGSRYFLLQRDDHDQFLDGSYRRVLTNPQHSQPAQQEGDAGIEYQEHQVMLRSASLEHNLNERIREVFNDYFANENGGTVPLPEFRKDVAKWTRTLPRLLHDQMTKSKRIVEVLDRLEEKHPSIIDASNTELKQRYSDHEEALNYETFSEGQRQVSAAFEKLVEQGRQVVAAFDQVRKNEEARRTDENRNAKMLIRGLGQIWHEYTGKLPDKSLGGPFSSFVDTIVEILNPGLPEHMQLHDLYNLVPTAMR